MATRKVKKAVKAKQKSAVKKPVKAAKAPVKAGKKPMAAGPVGIDWKRRFHPLQDRIVVIEIKETAHSPAGLILPESGKEGPARGEVVAVGTGHVNKKGRLRPLDVRVGDVVLVSSFAGTRVTVDASEAWILREDDVLGIVS